MLPPASVLTPSHLLKHNPCTCQCWAQACTVNIIPPPKNASHASHGALTAPTGQKHRQPHSPLPQPVLFAAAPAHAAAFLFASLLPPFLPCALPGGTTPGLSPRLKLGMCAELCRTQDTRSTRQYRQRSIQSILSSRPHNRNTTGASHVPGQRVAPPPPLKHTTQT